MYAEVVVDRPIVKYTKKDDAPPYPEAVDDGDSNKPFNPLAISFHYHIPDHLTGQVQVGHLVAVPFRTQRLTAIVIALTDISPVEETRPLEAILDPVPVVSWSQLQLAQWLSRECLAPLAICLKYFLPPGSGRKPEWQLRLTDKNSSDEHLLPAQEQILLRYLRQHGQVRWEEVEERVAQSLLDQGLVCKEAILSKPQVGPKMEEMVELLISPDEIEDILPGLGRSSKQADILHYLIDSSDPLPSLDKVLQEVGCTRGPAKALEERGWVQVTPVQTLVAVPPSPQQDSASLSDTEQEIVTYLRKQGYPVPIEAVVEAVEVSRSTVNELIRQEVLTRLKEPSRIFLTIEPDDFIEKMIILRGSEKHIEVLQLLALEEGPVWLGWVYAQTEANRRTLQSLAEAGAIQLNEARRWRDPLAERTFTLDTPPKLSSAQRSVWEAVQEAQRKKQTKPILLHGVTGSGKTEIYLRAIDNALQAGQGAIMLVPEIALATQTVERVAARFSDQVAVWHSALSSGERFDTWERVRTGELRVVVGPRSALFAPVKNLGVIVVDEEHEPVYKQQDRAPIFHAREAAIELARLSQALILLGSATPDVITYRKGERGIYQLLNLPHRILAHTKHLAVQAALIRRHKAKRGSKIKVGQEKKGDFVSLPLPQVEVVDLREELRAGNRTIFSRVLQQGIRETLQRGEQVILFLNRRGTSSFVICRDCGYVMVCAHCETTMTYHSNNELMVCHYCGYREPTSQVCPECNSQRIRYFGLGTQRVEQAVEAMFPHAKTIRWDWDTTQQKGRHDLFLQQFVSGQANVMVGTQMVAKGLDLPLVTLVGVISADTALYLPDFRAAERTFQLLMQVAGRAGRSPLGGRVIVQSYTPDLIPIEAAAQHNYEEFYRTELAFRREQQYPPFKRLALLMYRGSGLERSEQEAHQLVERLRLYIERQGIPSVQVIGPTPHYVRRVGSKYRWHVLIRAFDPPALLRPFMPLPRGWRVDIDPVSLL